MRKLIRRFASAHRSERTARTYASIANDFLTFLGRKRVPTDRDVERFLAVPLRSGAPRSVAARNQALAAVRAFARFSVKEGLWEADPTVELSFAREPEKDPAVLYIPEVQQFFRAIPIASRPSLRTRDRAILALLFTVGLRVAELVRLDVSQIDVASAILVAVRRKGGRIQDLPIASGAAHVLQSWLVERRSMARPCDGGLFVSSSGRRLSVRSVQRLFARLRTTVGTSKHATPHTARHSFVTLALAGGADVTVVSRVAGHASVVTTMRYRHLVDTEFRSAVALLNAAIPPELGPAESLRQETQETPPAAPISEPWTNNVPPANDRLDAQDHLDDVA